MPETEPRRDELGRVGSQVNIHPTVQLFNPRQIFIGDNVRIDCFCVISAGEKGVHIGNHVHLAAGVYIFGSGGKVALEDFSGLSSRVSVYTGTDDFSEGFLTGPTVPDAYRKVRQGDVTIRKHVIVGSGTVIMPDVEVGLAAAVGALSFIRKNVQDFDIVAGNPPRVIGRRNPQILDLEKKFLEESRPG